MIVISDYLLFINQNLDYYDVPALVNNLDFVVLEAFDFQTYQRNPKEADFPAPLYELNERSPQSNINAQVQYWLSNRAPASKVVVGIPTYGRAWKMYEKSGITGVPPLRVDKEGVIRDPRPRCQASSAGPRCAPSCQTQATCT